jgi:Zn-dependent M16 (insulinase) family peptidase
MWILLSGAINKENMLKNIDILDSAPENKPPETFERPFIGMKVPDITRNRNDLVTINGPCESNEGVVEISFLGKPAWDLEFCISMQVLSYYLTTTSSAPLKRELVLISDPYCDSVSLAIEELPLSKITAEFSGVPVEKLEQLPNKFFEVLRTSTTVDTLDIDRIRSIIDFKIKKLYAKVCILKIHLYAFFVGRKRFIKIDFPQSHWLSTFCPTP